MDGVSQGGFGVFSDTGVSQDSFGVFSGIDGGAQFVLNNNTTTVVKFNKEIKITRSCIKKRKAPLLQNKIKY